MNRNAKWLVVVFVVALAARLLALAVWLPHMKPGVDLDSYRSLAQHLAAGKGFVAVSDAGRELPNVSRTPLYPLFLAGLIRIGGDRLGWFLAVQCVLGALTCLLAVVLGSRWLSRAGAVVSGLLVAIDPNSVMRCVDLRTETLFTLLLVAGLCLLVRPDPGWWCWAQGGCLWSLATLCRPIAMWLWLVVLILALTLRMSWPRRLACFAAFFLAFLPLEIVWVARNVRLTGHVFFTTISMCDLLQYRAAGVEATRTHQPLETVQERFVKELGDIQFFDGRAAFEARLQNYRRTAMRILFSAPLLAVKQTCMGWPKVLFGPGAHSIDSMLEKPGDPARWWPALYGLGLVLLVFLGVVGAIGWGRKAMWLWAVALYFVVLVGGPESNSRFRTPITPMLAVLAVASARSLRNAS